MEFPKVDLAELERWKEKNQEERYKFIEQYAAWLKRTPNKEWSTQQAKMLK